MRQRELDFNAQSIEMVISGRERGGRGRERRRGGEKEREGE